jgi:hypothetical protein
MLWFRKKRQRETTSQRKLTDLPVGGLLDSNPDWVLVGGVSEHALQAAVKEHTSLTGCEQPVGHTVKVYRIDEDQLALIADPVITPYEALNLCVWLAGVGSDVQAAYAVAFLTSPESKLRYAFYPDLDNQQGDTLLGYDSDGNAVSAYAPEATLCTCSKTVLNIQEPAFPTGGEVRSFEVQLDHDPSFGNPNLTVTHPPNQAW